MEDELSFKYRVCMNGYEADQTLLSVFLIHADVYSFCEKHCQGKFFVSIFGWIDLELKEDFMYISLIYG